MVSCSSRAKSVSSAYLPRLRREDAAHNRRIATISPGYLIAARACWPRLLPGSCRGPDGCRCLGEDVLLKHLDKRIREETGLPVCIAEDPLCSVVLGTGEILSNF